MVDGELVRLRVEIRGAVQGVGFRPFVFRLASELVLTGWVINDSRGVIVEVEGPKEQVARFLTRLPHECPPHAHLHSLETTWLPVQGNERFEIRHSDDHGAKTTLMLPDLATCPDCLADVLDAANRRHGYPFANCTNCGPRFTIVQALPYDRPNTTMARFALCPDCLVEYTNPLDRRFHAQPTACATCGPQLALYAPAAPGGLGPPAAGERWPALIGGWALAGVAAAALDGAVAALAAGQIVAVKGLGGFHLMVDATNALAVTRLRDRKQRRAKPLAVMVRDLAQAHALCVLSEEAVELLASAAAPIVLAERQPGASVCGGVAPDNPNLGVMLPATPLHHLLLAALDRPLVATSGNLSDEPICTDEWQALDRLGAIADLFLVHDRPIARHVDDSVLWFVDGLPQFLRRARGYAPLPVMAPAAVPTILAVGALLKNTVALSVGRQVFVSQHIGNLESAPGLQAFERTIADFLRLYEAAPVAVAHDLHPDYLSTRWALTQSANLQSRISQSLLPTIAVQHHHAHLASCLADNNADGPALGVIWDGAGYGPDGTIWGGEFLLGDAANYRRVGSLRPFRLLGGDAAARQPRRVAFALLWEMFGSALEDWQHLAPLVASTPEERRLWAQMVHQAINAPITSSAGRLLDGIASLIGLHQQVSYEGQAAMALEFIADRYERGAYPLPLSAPSTEQLTFAMDWQPLLVALLADLRQREDGGIMAARVHNALVDAIVDAARLVGEPRVALSGGCFQNRRLTEQCAQRLRAAGLDVLLHRRVPPNDGGISLGQVAVAAAHLAKT